MNIINRSFFFFLITIFTLSFFFKSQSIAETTLVNEGVRFPGNTLQTTKTVETGKPGPRGPQVPEAPKVPESPESPESPDGGYWDTRLIDPQGPIR